MLALPALRAVVIAAPAAQHYAIAKKALLAGKDVFVEKPLALRIQDGEELVELAKRQSRISAMVGTSAPLSPRDYRTEASGSMRRVGKG